MSEVNNTVELNLEEMEEVSGGKYRRPAPRKGFAIYQIMPGDTLFRIAKAHRCTVDDLMYWNPKITNRNLIHAGDYLYIRR